MCSGGGEDHPAPASRQGHTDHRPPRVTPRERRAREAAVPTVPERRRTAGSCPAAVLPTLVGVSLSQHCPGRRRHLTWGPWPSSERSIGPETPSTPCSTRSSPSTWRSSCARRGPAAVRRKARARAHGRDGAAGRRSGRHRDEEQSPRQLGDPNAPGVRHRRAGMCPLWRPAAPDRHAARSRGHPENPRAPRPRPLGAESRPRPTRVRRHRALIGSALRRGGRHRAGAARWHSC